MNLIQITAPTGEPVTVDEVKTQARIDATEEEDLLDGYIKASVQRVEEVECWIQMITATFELRLDEFPSGDEPIWLPRPPLIAVSSVKYIDGDGAEQTLATSVYTVNAKSSHAPSNAEIYLAYNQTWPSTRSMRDAVKIRYTCGFGDAGDVPQALKNWIMANVASMFENRESVVIEAGMSLVLKLDFIDGLLDPYRARKFA